MVVANTARSDPAEREIVLRNLEECFVDRDPARDRAIENILNVALTMTEIVERERPRTIVDELNGIFQRRDGLNWQKVSDEIVKGEQIFGYSAQVFDNKIWLLGCNRNGQFSSQVLFSSDGKNWLTLTAPWLPRGGIAATVHNKKIYMTGGKYGGTPNHPDFRYDNDVWTLEKK